MKNLKLLIEEIRMLMNDDETPEVSQGTEVDTKPKKAKAKVAKKKVSQPKKKSATVSKKKAPKAKKKAEVEDGMVSLAQLAEESGISTASARRKLRNAEFDRGEGRWKWKLGSAVLKQVTKILAAGE